MPKTKTPVAPKGYDADFLGVRITVPRLGEARRADAVRLKNAISIPYTHFSLALSQSRRFAIWVAWNIDGGKVRKLSRKRLKFDFDARIPAKFQVGDDLYRANRLDRGHIARRADLTWGSAPEAQRANIESFSFTNVTPQMDNFNQSHQGGIWGALENAVYEEVEIDQLRISVFGGPIFHDDDRLYRDLQVPREFYKVLAYLEDGVLKAKGFLLTQRFDGLEVMELDPFKVFQVTLEEIETRCDFSFPKLLREADAFAKKLAESPSLIVQRKPIESLAEIDWAG